MNPLSLSQQLQQTVLNLELDLRGLSIYTEAAPNNYTAVLAAAGGADKVYALVADQKAADEALELAKSLKVESRLQFLKEKNVSDFANVDVLVVSKSLLPLDSSFIRGLTRTSAVISITETGDSLRLEDLDLEACYKQEIPAGKPNASSADPILFQAAGLRVGEILYLARERGSTAEESVEALEKSGFGFGVKPGKFLKSN